MPNYPKLPKFRHSGRNKVLGNITPDFLSLKNPKPLFELDGVVVLRIFEIYPFALWAIDKRGYMYRIDNDGQRDWQHHFILHDCWIVRFTSFKNSGSFFDLYLEDVEFLKCVGTVFND